MSREYYIVPGRYVANDVELARVVEMPGPLPWGQWRRAVNWMWR